MEVIGTAENKTHSGCTYLPSTLGSTAVEPHSIRKTNLRPLVPTRSQYVYFDGCPYTSLSSSLCFIHDSVHCNALPRTPDSHLERYFSMHISKQTQMNSRVPRSGKLRMVTGHLSRGSDKMTKPVVCVTALVSGKDPR